MSGTVALLPAEPHIHIFFQAFNLLVEKTVWCHTGTWIRLGGNICLMRSINVSGVVTFLLSTLLVPCKVQTLRRTD